MKNSILILIATGFAFLSNAQTKHEYQAYKQPDQIRTTEAGTIPLTALSSPLAPLEKNAHEIKRAPQAFSIAIHPIGQEPNALGTIGNRQYLWADPTINTVILTHRDTGAISNTGYLYYDRSKDMGRTWTKNNGPIYIPDATPQSKYFNARYPQGVIYNPIGNVQSDSAYEVYFAPSLDNSNPGAGITWGGHVFGVDQLSRIHPPTKNALTSSAVSNTWNYIPTSMFVTKQGTVYNLDANAPGSANYDMDDSVIISKGVFNPATRDFAYTISKVYLPAALTNKGKHMYNESKITFADDGMTGYISTIEKLDYASPDSSLGLVVHKTTNGGASWGAPIKLDVNAADVFLLNSHLRYTTGFEHSAVVDGNGNLHILVNINLFDSAQMYSYYLLPPYVQGELGLFDIYTKDGGVTWYEKLITHPMTFQGTYGQGTNASSLIGEGNRLYASRTYNGGKQLFFTWFDTDTIYSTRNIMPDMWSIGYDLTSNNWTSPRNFTRGSSADASTRQGMVSYYVFNSGNYYTIPCAYVGFPGNDTSQTLVTEQLNYIDSAQFVTGDFIIPDNSVPLALGIQEYKTAPLVVSQNYPNPCHNLTNVDVGLPKGTELSVETLNMLGQVVKQQEQKYMSAGTYSLMLDCSGLQPGIYFYSVRTTEAIITKRLIIQ